MDILDPESRGQKSSLESFHCSSALKAFSAVMKVILLIVLPHVAKCNKVICFECLQHGRTFGFLPKA